MPSARRVKLVGALIACSLLLVTLSVVLIAVLTVLCCHCRKNRINYNAIAMITAEERKERAKQYMAQFNPPQARPVVEAALVAKMV